MKSKRNYINYSIITLTTSIIFILAKLEMIMGFSFWDDEGYMLIIIKGIMKGNTIYDNVLCHYGPFFCYFFSFIFEFFDLEVNHYNMRIIIAVLWSICTLLAAFITLSITKCLITSIISQIFIFWNLTALKAEPGHPAVICTILALTIPLIISNRTQINNQSLLGSDILRYSILGIITALCLMTKLNCGIFCTISILSVILFNNTQIYNKVPTYTLLTLLVVMPFVLMHSTMNEKWTINYIIVYITSLFTVINVTLKSNNNSFQLKNLKYFILSNIITIFFVYFYTFINGTSLNGLIKGTIIDPISHPSHFIYALKLNPNYAYYGLIMFIIFKLIYSVLEIKLLGDLVMIIFKSIYFIIIINFMISDNVKIINFSIPLIWTTIYTLNPKINKLFCNKRFMITMLGLTLSLIAYPIAGSQIAHASIFLTLSGVIAFYDVINYIRHSKLNLDLRLITSSILLSFLCYNSYGYYHYKKNIYDNLFLLNLNGSETVKVNEKVSVIYNWLSSNINQYFKIFYTQPGLNSLYFFTNQNPPTWKNTTHWMVKLSEAEQKDIILKLSLERNACIIRSENLTKFWTQGIDTSNSPLINYIQSDFKILGQWEGYEILAKHDFNHGHLVNCAKFTKRSNDKQFLEFSLTDELEKVCFIELVNLNKDSQSLLSDENIIRRGTEKDNIFEIYYYFASNNPRPNVLRILDKNKNVLQSIPILLSE